MNPITLFTGSTGLNTTVDPVRLKFDPETGVSDLGVAVNIKIDDTGRPGRVDGFSEILTGSYHSVFCDGGPCFVGKGTALYQLGTDLSETGVRSGLSGDRIAFTQDLYTYYSNGTQNGVIKEGVSSAWPIDEYLGPDSSKFFEVAPIGNHLAFAFSRAFITQDDILWWSEPFRYGLFDKAINFVRFPTKILMIKPVVSGMYVSDEKKTYFLKGMNPHTFVQQVVAPHPAYEWSDAIDYVSGLEIGVDDPGLCAFWSSPEGAILGTANGQLININKSKVIYPEDGQAGASLVRGYDLIQTII